MNQCKRCNIFIRDEGKVCPLCNNVLTAVGDGQENTYPPILEKVQWRKRIFNFLVNFLVIIGIGLCVFDHYFNKKMGWSYLTSVSILYLLFTLFYSVRRRTNHIRKLFVQAVGTMVLLGFLDLYTGKTGWSVEYGFPIVILILNVVVIVCMLVNFRNWQNYLLVQIFAIIASGVLLLLFLFGIAGNVIFVWGAFGLSVVIFSFCLSLGNRRAKQELRKRFYI